MIRVVKVNTVRGPRQSLWGNLILLPYIQEHWVYKRKSYGLGRDSGGVNLQQYIGERNKDLRMSI